MLSTRPTAWVNERSTSLDVYDIAIAPYAGANQYTGSAYRNQSEFYDSWWHNFYCQQKQAGQANERSFSLDVDDPYQSKAMFVQIFIPFLQVIAKTLNE